MSEHATSRPAPVDYDELFPGRFLKAGLFRGKRHTLTIAAVEVEALPQDNGKDRDRGVISFRETPKQLVLNSTNGQCIRAMFGKTIANWIGKRVTLASEKARFGRETVDAVRVVGSPDIDHDIIATIALPRKKPVDRKLERTAPNGRSSKPRASQHEPPPEAYDDTTGEVGPAELREPGQEG